MIAKSKIAALKRKKCKRDRLKWVKSVSSLASVSPIPRIVIDLSKTEERF
jgi:hypothetical protein